MPATRSSSTARRATRCSPASSASCSPTAPSTTTTATGWSTTCSTTRRTTTSGTRMSMPICTTTTGWKEGRDPNAFFDTSIYLSANPDVAASGINPLTHYDTIGWQQGRVPSLRLRHAAISRRQSGREGGAHRSAFHFLAVGASEGRQPIAPSTLVAANGFDFVHYLRTIPMSRRRASIRSGTSRTSAGRKAATRTRCSTRPAISRPTPTSPPRTSIRSTTTMTSAGTRAAIRRSPSTRRHISRPTPTSRPRTSIR